MFKKLIPSVVLIAFLFSCNNSDKVETVSGLTFKYIERGDGSALEEGEKYMLVNLTYKDEKDSVWFNSLDRGTAMIMTKSDSLLEEDMGTMNEIFIRLMPGDSITCQMSVSDLFSKTFKAPIPQNVDSSAILTFNIGIEDIISQDSLEKWQQKAQMKMQTAAAKKAESQKMADETAILEYLESKGVEAQKTESGLYYVIHEEGIGRAPEFGDMVAVNYTGKLLSGSVFDTSNKEIAEANNLYDPRREPYEPIKFQLGAGRVIPGWDEGISLLKEGAKATLYIPSGLAYGPRAMGNVIPANSILEFDVELVTAATPMKEGDEASE